MFSKNKKSESSKTVSNDNYSANTIQNGTEIEGIVNSEGSIRIDGKLNGSITTKAKLVVGKTGVITGDVFCENASIEGKIEGKITVQGLLDLKTSGLILGDIITNKLVVEEGARFDGKCTMGAKVHKANINGKKEFTHKKAV